MGFGNNDSYRIVNPSVANNYFTAASSPAAITSANQPNVDGGTAIMGNGTNQSKLDGLALGSTETEIYGSQVIRGASSGNGVSAELPQTGGDFATLTAGRYIMRRGGANTEFVAGVADTTLRSAGSDYGDRRSINNRLVVRGPLTATAVRNNQWNEFSGNWTSDPTDSTYGLGNVQGDTAATQTAATGGGDHAVFPPGLTPGELVYMAGNSSTILVPVQDDYKVKTTR